MSELFSIDHRAEADGTDTYRLEELLVAYSPAAFFEPDQFGVDGTRRIRVLTHRDVSRAQCLEAAEVLAAAASG